jgi:AcrR family transcriptional regulator
VQRQKTVDAGRDRIVAAARELLEADDAEAFSIEAVARRAKVARMTVYNQFESKAGLLEALFDSLAADGFGRVSDVFAEQDPVAALDAFIGVFGRFWSSNRRAQSRLSTAARSDPELAAAIMARNERRRQGLAELVKRLGARAHPVVPKTEVVNVLFVLLGFDTFHALAGPERAPNDIVPLMRKLVHGVLGLESDR